MFSMESIYGLNGRDAKQELMDRYEAMVNTLSTLLDCGRWDVEELFDSKNNIEVGEIVKEAVEGNGIKLPDWNYVYREALYRFAAEHHLEVGVDVDITTNFSSDTDLYVSENLDPQIKEELEDLFNLEANVLEREDPERE